MLKRSTINTSLSRCGWGSEDTQNKRKRRTMDWEKPYPALDVESTPFDLLDGSLFIFLLSNNVWAVFFGLIVAFSQVAVLYIFFAARKGDETYCAANCLVSASDSSVFEGFEPRFDKSTTLGRTLMFLALWVFTWPEIGLGLQLIFKWYSQTGQEKWAWKHVRVALIGLLIWLVATAALWVSGLYTYSTSLSDAESLLNIVGILYILDSDEKAHDFVKRFSPVWEKKILQLIKQKYAVETKAEIDEIAENVGDAPAQSEPASVKVGI